MGGWVLGNADVSCLGRHKACRAVEAHGSRTAAVLETQMIPAPKPRWAAPTHPVKAGRNHDLVPFAAHAQELQVVGAVRRQLAHHEARLEHQLADQRGILCGQLRIQCGADGHAVAIDDGDAHHALVAGQLLHRLLYCRHVHHGGQLRGGGAGRQVGRGVQAAGRRGRRKGFAAAAEARGGSG